jgi:predicted ATPase
MNVTYIDTPVIFQLVKLLGYSEVAEKEYMPTIKDLQRKLNSLPQKIDVWEKEDIEEIVARIRTVIKGDVDRDELGNFVFSRGNFSFKIENTATGIKSFALLLLLLKYGWLKRGTLLVIDEPEVHLHPKWQVEYCKVIIELIKRGITVIIATHSPYIVQGFAKYIREHNLRDQANFYLMRNVDGVAVCKNVNNELHLIFKLLAEPFDEIF